MNTHSATLIGLALTIALMLPFGAPDAWASDDIEALRQDLHAGRYQSVWTRAQDSQEAEVLALGADAATSDAFCRRFDEAARPTLDKAIALSEQAIEAGPGLAESRLQFARAKGAWLRRYAFTPELLEACTDSFSRFSNLFRVPRLLGLKQEAGKVAQAFREAISLEPANGVALAGLGATELLEPLHPCVDDYTEEKAVQALQRLASGLDADGPPQLKSFIVADALQTARDEHGLSEELFRRQGLNLDQLWQTAAEPCEAEAYCQCMADRAREQLGTGGTQ